MENFGTPLEFNLFVTKMYSYEIFIFLAKIAHRLNRNERILILSALIEFNIYVTKCSDT